MFDSDFIDAGLELSLKFAKAAVIVALICHVLYLVARWIPPED